MTTTTEISQRFVEAFYKLYAQRIVKTKKEYCTNCGIANTNFCTLEKGGRQVSLAHICTLIDAYHVSPLWLFTGEGNFMYYREGE